MFCKGHTAAPCEGVSNLRMKNEDRVEIEGTGVYFCACVIQF